MTRCVTIGGVKLHQNEPLKIAVPLVGKNKEELLKAAKIAVNHQVDIVEWRLDFFEQVANLEQVLAVLAELNEVLQKVPLILTLRTTSEGGHFSEDWSAYYQLLKPLLLSGDIAAIDIQLGCSEALRAELLNLAANQGVTTILSYHQFESMPPIGELIEIVETMGQLNPKILKLAVMVTSETDLLPLMVVKEHWQTVQPLILIGMGPLGRETRTMPNGVLTFATLEEESAPGQLSVVALRQALKK